MNKKLKLIRDAAQKLHWAFDAQMFNWADRLIDECCAEERDHRRFLNGTFDRHHPDAFSVRDAGRLFAVVRVAQYLLGEKFPVGQAYLHTQRSCFTAAGMVDEYRKAIIKEWKSFDLKELAELDYCEFVARKQVVA